MPDGTHVEFKVLDGPNLLTPFAAAVAEFKNPFSDPLPSDDIERLFAQLLPADLLARLCVPLEDGGFEHVCAALAAGLQDLHGPNGLPVQVLRADATISKIALGFHDPHASIVALHAGLELASAVFAFARGRAKPFDMIANVVRQTGVAMQARQPDYIARALMRVARTRGIPVYPVAAGSRVWQFGQGCAGFQFFEAANHRDSLTGLRLAGDKFASNQLISRLGFPGVVHGVAESAATAMQLAHQIGFPVVVKPVDGGKGRGVTARVESDDELGVAFAKADSVSPRRVLVERQVSGDDHRLVVLGGKLAWGVRRSPPRIIGDGQRSIMELIDAENALRSDADVAAGFVTRLQVDTDMRELLGKQGYTLADRPAKGTAVPLRTIANTATGGTIAECTADIHPDTREMAEAIARSFHLDAVGIDFMTTDIRKSWREIPCAVLEINPTPGFSSDGRAEIILRDKFPEGTNGRIPSVVVVGRAAQVLAQVVCALEDRRLRVGWTDSVETMLGGYRRFENDVPMPARVMSLLLDPSCDALAIAVTPEEIRRHGFPLDRCDLALIADGEAPDDPIQRLARQCATRLVHSVSEENFEKEILPALACMHSATPA